MKYFGRVLQVFTISLLISGCKKNSDKGFDCDRFKQGVLADDKASVATALGGLLTSYSRENINQLAEAASRQCNINATVLCFDCIYTNTAQTEIKITFTQDGTTVDKVLDISYSSGNKMTIVGVHD